VELSGQLHAPTALPSVEGAYIGKETGWAPEPVWTQWRRENIYTPEKIYPLFYMTVNLGLPHCANNIDFRALQNSVH